MFLKKIASNHYCTYALNRDDRVDMTDPSCSLRVSLLFELAYTLEVEEILDVCTFFGESLLN